MIPVKLGICGYHIWVKISEDISCLKNYLKRKPEANLRVVNMTSSLEQTMEYVPLDIEQVSDAMMEGMIMIISAMRYRAKPCP